MSASQNPFGSVKDARLAPVNAMETGQLELIFTRHELDRMSNTMIRRLAASLDTDDINGKSPKFQIVAALACQRSLLEYAEE